MGYAYYDLRELYYDTNNAPTDISKEIKNNVGYGGPFLRYKVSIDKPEKPVKLRLTSRRFYEFEDVGGKLEIIFSDGKVMPISGDTIELPKPYHPCKSDRWQDWKRFNRCPSRILKIYTFNDGIVVLSHLWADCDVYTMKAYKHGKPFGRINCPNKCDPGEAFFKKMIESDYSEYYIEILREKYGIM